MDLIRALLSVWTSARSVLLTFWRRLIYGIKVIDVERGADQFPPAPKAIREAADAFLESLQTDAIEALASRYNDGKPCRVFFRLHGSFNVCYFVVFEEGPSWTVRIPITPRLYRPWDKILSEVATLRYIRSQTSIPVPVVCAFGDDATLTDDKTQHQSFLISEFVGGTPLYSDRLADADDAARKRFFLQLFDYLAQLRSLEFQQLGSLMPATTASPSVGNLMSFSTNSFRLQLPSFTTAKDYILSQFDILQRQATIPIADYSETDSRYELFALHTVKTSFDEFASDVDASTDEPFVLNHADLHLANILVDEDLNILGIIDWEFANIVPLRLFMPPLWAIYQAPGLEKLTNLFVPELQAASLQDVRFERLYQEWYGKPGFGELCYLARLIRHPSDITQVFADYFEKKRPGDNLEKAESTFFADNPEMAIKAREIAEKNIIWTQHLKDSGMYESDK
ncbi:kinase-like domain [Cordyceps militaris]|uniref:Kinase-like domain n=1 Tax=Cordyceps militaris TaxID=73501 RepID=A0A2H4SM22_CORMI|nr:kinase-like domain [Cordyceps militaris]